MKTQRTTRPATESDKRIWSALAGHPLQSWEWGEFRRRTGIGVRRYVTEYDGKPEAVFQCTLHPVPHTPWSVGYCPKSGILHPEVMGVIGTDLAHAGAAFVQYEPNLTDASDMAEVAPLLTPAHHPLFTQYTFVLDLTKTETELLAAMHPKTRYNIKVAQKHGVIVREDNSDTAFASYLRLSDETTRRQGFFAHNESYHRKMWDTLHSAGIARLWTASCNGTVLAAWVIFVWHDTAYYPYGASSRDRRETMAPNLLLWEIARTLKSEGIRAFDLWGAMGPEPDTKDPWYGFHRFKEGYRPRLTRFVGSYDHVLNPLVYSGYKIADKLRWTLLRMKNR